MHSSALLNFNVKKIIYPVTDHPYDDLLLYIKYKYIFKESIKLLNLNTCDINLKTPGRWSDKVKCSYGKKNLLKKIFFLVLKKKLALKKISKKDLFKIFTKYNILQSLYILYKIFKSS